ncbi:hypothetical protein [Micromonospora echinaurantiaca]|uniref:hypothetical protein n=1 Tax=Micromonospora echinaurantiaca TaxID=47857 RepID=UPI000B5AF869|nr:hypothetical protein [Micromonospora echinaurantiaca]
MARREGGKHYEVFSDLVGVVLEDSWVLDVDVSATAVVFKLEAALAPEHPAYQSAAANETHCYREATLTVRSGSAIHVRRSTAPFATDASGEPDYGHIDTLHLAADHGPDVWEMTGDWGEALVRQPHVDLQLRASTRG